MDKYHILIVDDNHINRLFFQSALKKLGYLTTLAEDGYKALTQCESIQFDLILMDIRMTGMDGVETTAKIKTSHLNKDTPILAVSAESFATDKHPNFAGSLLKPVDQNTLQATIDSYLGAQQVFDQELALSISHDDDVIVLKLRELLVQQLPIDEINIKTLYAEQDWNGLADALHKLMGSAKVCAAVLLSNQAANAKQEIDCTQQLSSRSLKKLLEAIKTTIAWMN